MKSKSALVDATIFGGLLTLLAISSFSQCQIKYESTELFFIFDQDYFS